MTGARLFLVRMIAGALAVGTSLPLLEHTSNTVAVLVPPVSLLAAALVVFVPSLGAQLLARSAWWANLVLGVLLAAVGSHVERIQGTVLLVGCAGALVLLSDRGLVEAQKRSGFNPAAYTTTLMLAMVLALADTLSLLLFGLLALSKSGDNPVLLLSCAAAMIVGFVGLYNMKPWGLVSNLVLNVAIAALALTGSLGVDDEIVALFTITAALQLLVPMPMLVSVLTRRPLWKVPAAFKRMALNVVVGLMTALGIALALVR